MYFNCLSAWRKVRNNWVSIFGNNKKHNDKALQEIWNRVMMKILSIIATGLRYCTQCFSKVDTVITDKTHCEATHNTDLSSKESFIDTIVTKHSVLPGWLSWNFWEQKFCSGAEASAVSEKCYQTMGKPHLARFFMVKGDNP